MTDDPPMQDSLSHTPVDVQGFASRRNDDNAIARLNLLEDDNEDGHP